MPNAVPTQQRPTSTPAMTPKEKLGDLPINNAMANAEIKANVKEPPKMSATLPRFRSASASRLAAIQGFANNAEEYQAPPIRNADSAAVSTAQ